MTSHPRTSRRRPLRAAPRCAGIALLAAIVLTGCSPAPPPSPEIAVPRSAAPTASAATPGPTATPVARGLAPVSVSIPAIDLSQRLIDLGVAADGALEVPTDFAEVGWFTGGGRPGGHGPLVIAGHVDSPSGPAVFARLRELAPGDTVEVTDAAGTVHAYTVSEVADYPKTAFPTARVFGAVRDDQLRLITCGGVFDRTAGSYEDNRVVYAVRV